MRKFILIIEITKKLESLVLTIRLFAANYWYVSQVDASLFIEHDILTVLPDSVWRS